MKIIQQYDSTTNDLLYNLLLSVQANGAKQGMVGVSFVATAKQTMFNLPSVPTGLASMFRNGVVKVNMADFNVPVNTSVGTYSGEDLQAGDYIEIIY